MSVFEQSVFEQDTHIEQGSTPNVYHAQLSNRWTVGAICNGGYVMSVAAKAMAQKTPHPDPLSITGYYLDKSEPGPIDIDVETIREGKSVSTVGAKLYQGGSERVRFIASFTELEKSRGHSFFEADPPSIPSVDQCELFIEPRIAIHNRFDLYLPPQYMENRGQEGNESELIGWVKFKDGGTLDLYSLILFSDALPPAVFNRTGPVGWVPTIELTVHLRAKPKPGLLLCRFRTRYLTNGVLEEDADIWDSEGNLVAISRQMAKLRLREHRTI